MEPTRFQLLLERFHEALELRKLVERCLRVLEQLLEFGSDVFLLGQQLVKPSHQTAHQRVLRTVTELVPQIQVRFDQHACTVIAVVVRNERL